MWGRGSRQPKKRQAEKYEYERGVAPRGQAVGGCWDDDGDDGDDSEW